MRYLFMEENNLMSEGSEGFVELCFIGRSKYLGERCFIGRLSELEWLRINYCRTSDFGRVVVLPSNTSTDSVCLRLILKKY